MSRRALLMAMAAAVVGCRAEREASNALVVTPSALALVSLDGAPGSLAQWQGRRLVLNVWASWCAPCRAEMASLQALSDRLDSAQALVVGLAIDDDPHLVREYLRRAPVRFPIVLQAQPHGAARELAVRALPETLLLDTAGRVTGRELGARDWTDATLQARWRLPLQARVDGGLVDA
jgi:thiol-disulfide isomerase/thioredoxin